MTLGANSAPEKTIGDRTVALGAMASSAANVIKAVLQLLLLPVMARLLGPDEFGLYALAMPTVTLVALLADGGLGASLAREDESVTLVWSTAFWALLLLGLVLAVGTSMLGVLLGYLSQQPRLPGMIALLSLSLVFLTMSVVPSARLARRRNLQVGAGSDMASTLIGSAIAVILALHGAGAWSLVAQYVAIYAVRAIIINAAAFHLPRAEFSLSALRPHLATGGILVASRIFEYSGRMSENFLMGRIFGTASLGNYTFANQISKFSADTVGNVVWAAIYVQALTTEKAKIVILHRRLCRLLGVMLFPAMVLTAAAAPELISVTLGPKWEGLSFLLRLFLPLYAINAICGQTGPVLLAYGRFDIAFWCMVGLSCGRVLAVALGFWIGFAGAIYCIVVVTLLFNAAMLIFPADATGCRPLPILIDQIRPVLSSLAAAGGYLAIIDLFPMSVIWLGTSLGAGFVVYALCMFLADRKGLNEDWAGIRQVMSSRAAR
jgi:O-antigen/teichoic acid export membrane protein